MIDVIKVFYFFIRVKFYLIFLSARYLLILFIPTILFGAIGLMEGMLMGDFRMILVIFFNVIAMSIVIYIYS